MASNYIIASLTNYLSVNDDKIAQDREVVFAEYFRDERITGCHWQTVTNVRWCEKGLTFIGTTKEGKER